MNDEYISADDIVGASGPEVVFDFSGAGEDFSVPLEDDDYVLTLTEANPKESKSGNPMVQWIFQTEGGRHIHKYTVLTGKAAGFTRTFLRELGVDVDGDKVSLRLADLVGNKYVATVGRQANDNTRNEIKSIRPLDDGINV